MAREARWNKLLLEVDPEGVMPEEDREDAARALRRKQLTEYGRLGRAAQEAQQAEFKVYVERRDNLIRLHEEMADLLRGAA